MATAAEGGRREPQCTRPAPMVEARLSSPKFPDSGERECAPSRPERSRGQCRTDYNRTDTPSKSNARCCKAVGVARRSSVASSAPPGRTWFWVSVARSGRSV